VADELQRHPNRWLLLGLAWEVRRRGALRRIRLLVDQSTAAILVGDTIKAKWGCVCRTRRRRRHIGAALIGTVGARRAITVNFRFRTVTEVASAEIEWTHCRLVHCGHDARSPMNLGLRHQIASEGTRIRP